MKPRVTHGAKVAVLAEFSHFFNDSLFWDIDTKTLDTQAHAGFIIERVVSRGALDDWRRLLDFYGEERVRREVVALRCLDKKSLHFLSIYFEIDMGDFRCCN